MRVLLIDDEDDIREVASLCLSAVGGMEVIEAASGPEGVELARQRKPDLVVLDMMMPGVDGPATMTQLRDDEATREIPVIFLTARASASDTSRLESMGAIGVLTKPFDPATLADQVRRLYERRER